MTCLQRPSCPSRHSGHLVSILQFQLASPKNNMPFDLPSLPYDYGALEPHVDAQTMTIHHTGHHKGYVSFVNKGVDQSSSLKDCSLLDIVRKVGTGDLPGDVEKLLRDNAGGHWNHSFFWKIMCRPSDTSGPGGDLKKKIEEDFGSVDAMREQFNARAAGRFGSGWAWLGLAKDNKLIVCDTMNQDNPLMSLAETPCIPILGLDVWEHAYYLKYQNRRAEYIQAWWNVVNWERAEENLKAAHDGVVAEVV